MNKYEIRTMKKKNSIIMASLELFKEKGYTETSIGEIATRAQVSQVSIYNYFGNKKALVTECMKILLEGLMENVEGILTSDLPFPIKLKQATDLCASGPQSILTEYFSENALNDNTFEMLLKDSASKFRMEIMESFIDSGKKAGYIDTEIPTETILNFLTIALELQTSGESAEHIYELVLYGLIGKKP